jgi:hypothetical protein
MQGIVGGVLDRVVGGGVPGTEPGEVGVRGVGQEGAVDGIHAQLGSQKPSTRGIHPSHIDRLATSVSLADQIRRGRTKFPPRRAPEFTNLISIEMGPEQWICVTDMCGTYSSTGIRRWTQSQRRR